MENIPFYINASFILTTLLTIAIFYKATNYSPITMLVIFIWLALQSMLTLSGFYKITNTLPLVLISHLAVIRHLSRLN